MSTIPARLPTINASMLHASGPEHLYIERGAERITNPELIELQRSAKYHYEYAKPA
jgi:hypothetical protein